MRGRIYFSLLLVVMVLTVTAPLFIEPAFSESAFSESVAESDAGTVIEAKTVKIGFLLPLTGKRASLGEDARDGALLATGQLKKKEGINITPVFEDSQADPAKGVIAYRKLVSQGIKIIASQHSAVSLPVSPLANRDKVIQLGIGTTADSYSSSDDYTFRVNGLTKHEAQYMVKFILGRMGKESKLAVLTMEDEYPLSLSKNVMAELMVAKAVIPVEQNFLPDDLDFRSVISSLRQRKVTDVIFLGYQTQAGFFIRQSKELGLNLNTVVNCVPVNSSEFFEVAKEAAEGVFVSYIRTDENFPATIEFRKKYGRSENLFSANAYDAVMIAARALKGCSFQEDSDCLKKELFKIKDFEGMSGTKGFDDVYGDMSDEYHVMIARDGRFVPYDK